VSAAQTAIGVQRIELDVSSAAPPGARTLVAELFAPEAGRLAEPPVLLACLPGGGMSRRYFDLRVPGDGGYSMARHLASRGFLVATLDPLGVGESDSPDDGWTLTPERLAQVHASALAQLRARLAAGGLAPALPPVADLVSIGVGHSAGALLTVYQQAASRCHDAIALLGFAGCGLPAALTEPERRYAGDPAATHRDLAALARARFREPLPGGGTAASEYLIAVPVPDAARHAIAEASSRMLSLVGQLSLIPGASRPQLEAIDVPVFLGVGERDILEAPHAIPAEFPHSGDVTLYVVRGSGHNHNVAPTRARLWDRLAAWAHAQAAAARAR
jgi:pimeloyl-ACP methyl ester carboxylesterase